MRPRAAITGLSGLSLTGEEAALLRATPPAGVILFRRNVDNPAQLSNLTSDIREILGQDAPVLVDQEGGRVARLRPPYWPSFPPPARFEGEPAARAGANAALLGAHCAAMGLDVVCAPCLDLRVPGAHEVIGDRAFSTDPAEVARLGEAWIEGLMAAGCVPVIKHIPGHGRANADSHIDLPRVEADRATLAADIAPFREVCARDAGRHLWAMTAHVTYTAIDPDRPATLSPSLIGEIIRGEIGFDGVLVSDDLVMGALNGFGARLAEASLAAGCDLVLHCNGVLEETAALLRDCPVLTEAAQARTAAARQAALAARPPARAAAATTPSPALPHALTDA
ncbi:beta-N-acetylhexosaminidase [Roseomonas sp. SSH11]|uniref:beta-N-acetylhexosaminidase n=1 Tax=Pararoseomonas baculiformis TaxID=2820812 RepID=A0ABS4AAE0_9PROT|nr:beta-N-acetylhexosaminidase [Pararoseomonas baculiformis]MBP0443972.1 beta-N-acetylhexosaminidase [Pararoseomonas baculiformis]